MVGAAATRRCFEAVPCSRSSDRCETVSQSSKQRTHHQVTRQSSTSESMEKELQPESMATVTIKPEYPPSEVYGSEPPPVIERLKISVKIDDKHIDMSDMFFVMK
ncbi:unnamed protein product [Acanthoscelides obtectus]|uniref:Uncharacterized protein n=1 Tax=Acanthoscelides obtectus TaxID=200917 RepID=A0A9P0Q455_ACAOB|nr:unnamed protein product [Acanthoscelides obtectus]CAK1647570.1 hypothetical protein AOBTE_LOCUS15271 [Acanthoscelides obtectus]